MVRRSTALIRPGKERYGSGSIVARSGYWYDSDMVRATMMAKIWLDQVSAEVVTRLGLDQ